MPLRGILGSDLLKYHPGWKEIQNPFSNEEDPIVAIPAIQPDIALFHAPLADREGNVWLGRKRELVNMAQASKATFVTVDRITDTNLYENEETAAGVLPALYVDKVCLFANGSWPLPFWYGASGDDAHLREYMKLARTDEGFAAYLDQHIFGEGLPT